MRRSAARCAVLLAAVPALVACQGTTGGSNASCVGPWLDDRPPARYFTQDATPTVKPGDSLTVYGHGYTSTCNDTSEAHDPLEPLPPVRLTARFPDGTLSALGEFSPRGRDMGFSVPVHVPVTASEGDALVSDNLDHTYRINVVRTSPQP